jgi:hypothetical protein
MMAKLSTRRYRAGLEPVGTKVEPATPPSLTTTQLPWAHSTARTFFADVDCNVVLTRALRRSGDQAGLPTGTGDTVAHPGPLPAQSAPASDGPLPPVPGVTFTTGDFSVQSAPPATRSPLIPAVAARQTSHGSRCANVLPGPNQSPGLPHYESRSREPTADHFPAVPPLFRHRRALPAIVPWRTYTTAHRSTVPSRPGPQQRLGGAAAPAPTVACELPPASSGVERHGR